MNKISVVIGDSEYTDLLSYELSEDLETLVKPFSLTLSIPNNRNLLNVYELIKIKIDGEDYLSGYVDSYNESDNGDKQIISIKGRDIFADLVDSSIGAKIYKTPIKIEELIKNILTELGYIISPTQLKIKNSNNIAIINNYGEIPILNKDDDVVHRDIDSTFDVIKRCADKRQLILTSDGIGNLLINKIGDKVYNTILLRNKDNRLSNIQDSSIDIDVSKRFYKYQIRSIATGKGGGTSDGIIDPIDPRLKEKDRQGVASSSVNANGVAYDTKIRKTRIYTDFRQVSSLKKAQERAEWESNIRQAQSLNYNCQVYGFRENLDENIKSNKLWRVNNLVDVEDEIRNVFGRFLIKEVKFIKNDKETKTFLTLVNEKAYSESMFEPLVKRAQAVKGTKGRDLIISPF